MRMFVIIFAALLVAGGSGFYLMQGLSSGRQVAVAESAPAELPKSVDVLVPAVPVAAGSLLNRETVRRLAIPAESVNEAMIVADEAGYAMILGSVAIHGLAQGVPIARASIVQPGDRGFLAAVLPKGKRAISIPISETAGLSGLVMPGDRVDIILTYSVMGAVIDVGRDIRASETVLTNLRVLALDRRLQAGDSLSQQVNPTDMGPVARTATLEVTPQEAEMLTLATQLGELSLVLNSVRDGGNPDDYVEGGEPAKPAARRALTLDSQVTSLLKRELALMGEFAPDPALAAALPDGSALRPLPERITRVQVVRGIDSNALEFSGAEGEGANGAEPAAD